MNQRKRHKIALFFLLLYVPVVMGVSFFHSHALPELAEQHQVSTQKTDDSSAVQPDLFCTICKFLSSHNVVFNTGSQAIADLGALKIDFTPLLFTTNRIYVLSDRAPPFLA